MPQLCSWILKRTYTRVKVNISIFCSPDYTLCSLWMPLSFFLHAFQEYMQILDYQPHVKTQLLIISQTALLGSQFISWAALCILKKKQKNPKKPQKPNIPKISPYTFSLLLKVANLLICWSPGSSFLGDFVVWMVRSNFKEYPCLTELLKYCLS